MPALPPKRAQRENKSVKYLPLAIVNELTVEDTDVSRVLKNKKKKTQLMQNIKKSSLIPSQCIYGSVTPIRPQ